MRYPMGDLMKFAVRELYCRLGDDQFTDDWQWGDGCFQFVIVTGYGSDAKVSGPYRFCYDPDEEFCGTAKEQLMKWLDERF